MTSQGWPCVWSQTAEIASGANRWPVLGGVLAEQGAHLVLREVGQPQCPGRDVEGNVARVDALAHVAHAAEDNTVGEALRAVHVARSQLPQHGDQRVAHERVDLVDEEDEGARVGGGPAREEGPERTVRVGGGVQRARDRRDRFVAQGDLRLVLDGVQNVLDRFTHLLPRGLRGLHVDVHAAVVADGSAVQQVAQGEQRRGLAGLAGRVQHEVARLAHQGEHLAQVDALQRRDAVVPVGPDGAGGVEVAHGPKVARAGGGGNLHLRDARTRRTVGRAAFLSGGSHLRLAEFATAAYCGPSGVPPLGRASLTCRIRLIGESHKDDGNS